MLSSAEYNLKKSIFLFPKFIHSYSVLSDLYMILKEPDLAINILCKCIELDSNNINIHIKYIKILINQKNKNKSSEAIRIAMNIFPDSKDLEELEDNI